MSLETASLVAFVAIALCGVLWLVWVARRRERQFAARQAYEDAPFSPRWKAVLRRRMPLYSRLPAEVRGRLHAWVKVFLAEKHFTACGGIGRISDSMAVTIAGHACLLLAGRSGGRCFPSVDSVLVYPDWFYSRTRHHDPNSGAEIVSVETLAGEANPMGSVVVSWREVLHAAAFTGNGQNIVLHEFAHHLTPTNSSLRARLEREFLAFSAAPDDDAVLDAYGAENRDEFWAVSVEAFFETPTRFRAAHPDWYAALADFFRLSPADWGEGFSG